MIKIDSQESALLAILKSEICQQHETYAKLHYVSGAHADWLLSYTVYLAAIPNKSRIVNSFYGTVVQLTPQSFATIAKLCLHAYLADHFQLAGITNRWVHSEELWKENTARYIHKTRDELKTAGLATDIITNDTRAAYSILIPTEDIVFNLDRLCRFDNTLVSKPAVILQKIVGTQ